MKTFLACLALACLVSNAPSVRAQSFEGKSFTIDFTNEKDAVAKATWSEPDKIAVTSEGLGKDGQQSEQIEGWIQTEPLAVGLSSQPAQDVTVRLAIGSGRKLILLKDGQTITPFGGEAFARFSPDGKHWSTWQVLEDQPLVKGENGSTFKGNLSVPQRERQEYMRLWQAYSKLDVPWIDDEEALVKWILARDAQFFERSLPFIGYVEFLFEAPFAGGKRITVLDASARYSLSGLGVAPKDPSGIPHHEGPWRFKAP